MTSEPADAPPTPSTASRGDGKREPHLLHFGMKQMLVFVTLMSVLLTLLVATDGVLPLLIGVSALLVSAHVFGTLIGTRLRDTSEDVRRWRWVARGVMDEPIRSTHSVECMRQSLPKATLLAECHGAPLRDRLAPALGAAVGFASGLAFILIAVGPQASWPGALVGAVSCAVLGGWITWLATGFGSTARNAWREANDAENRRANGEKPSKNESSA